MNRGSSRTLSIGGVASLVLIAGCIAEPSKRLVLNTTASAPLGFYWLSDRAPKLGDLALVRPPAPLARWMAVRGYLPLNVPLIKHVAAVGGQIVCGGEGILTVDGRVVAQALRHDRHGRPLAVFKGCRLLRNDEVLLLNPDAPGSLDGRYFGPLPRHCVMGRLRALWTWER